MCSEETSLLCVFPVCQGTDKVFIVAGFAVASFLLSSLSAPSLCDVKTGTVSKKRFHMFILV